MYYRISYFGIIETFKEKPYADRVFVVSKNKELIDKYSLIVKYVNYNHLKINPLLRDDFWREIIEVINSIVSNGWELEIPIYIKRSLSTFPIHRSEVFKTLTDWLELNKHKWS